jgi:hypothetical protein
MKRHCPGPRTSVRVCAWIYDSATKLNTGVHSSSVRHKRSQNVIALQMGTRLTGSLQYEGAVLATPVAHHHQPLTKTSRGIMLCVVGGSVVVIASATTPSYERREARPC